MTRLIDADALKEYIDCGHLRDPGELCFSEIDVVELIDAQPTVDLRKVTQDYASNTTIDAVPRWIPCSEMLPEEPFGCLVTVWDTDPVTMDEFENILPYFVGWDGEQWNDGEGLQCPFEVIAWMPLPEPYEVEND